MNLDQLFTQLDFFICLAILIRIVVYQRADGPYPRFAAWLTWGIAVASSSVVLRIWFGSYKSPVDMSEVLFNGVVCVALYAHHGDIRSWLQFTHRGAPHHH